jgi:glycosyltransferase involved in cell wall biosynthesis
MRITFVIPNLESGGAERVMSILANYWVKKGWQVTILTFDDGSTPPFFEIDSRIRLIPLNIHQVSSNFLAATRKNLKRLFVLRRAINASKPDVVISFLYYVNVLVLLSTRALGFPVVVSEHNDPLMKPIGRVLDWLRRWTYTFNTQVVVLTERAKACFPPKIQSRISVIPNPVPPIISRGRASPDGSLETPSLVAMGRFHRQKGFDLLLRAFARINNQYPDWSLTIFGDGPLREQMESLCDELGLKDCVYLPGRVQNPHHFLQQADLFALSSRWEGWPMVLMEALSCGLPVVAADCRSGPREIIRDGVDGILVPPEDVPALAEALSRLMSDEVERKRLASRAPEVTERFGVDKVMGMWEELLMKVVLP